MIFHHWYCCSFRTCSCRNLWCTKTFADQRRISGSRGNKQIDKRAVSSSSVQWKQSDWSVGINQAHLIKNKSPVLFSDHGGWRPDERAYRHATETLTPASETIHSASFSIIYFSSVSLNSDFCWKTRRTKCAHAKIKRSIWWIRN